MGNENKNETKVKKILINKSYDQLRVARIEGQKLYDIEIDQLDSQQKIDDIYNAEVVSVERSLGAAFVNYGPKRNGFLPLKEIAPEYYPPHLKNKPRVDISDILFEGQKLLIQVIKEERGTKGAALSTYVTIAGCYLVLMPNNPQAGGVSRRIEGEERDILKKMLNSLRLPNEMGVIIRTAGIGKSLEELQWDLDTLINLWNSIQEASKTYGAPYLIHQESDIAIKSIRDHFRQDIDEVLIDDQEIYNKIRSYIEKMRPDFLHKVKLYTQLTPLFSRFQIEQQIESIFKRKVRLLSGGEIVIDRTEALTAIDVNSAQATKGEYIEQTALLTNLEAAEEIARQLRMRDLGGLFVIDFIDMEEEENNRKVEDCLRVALREDRARTQLARISRFGLLEMSRQRIRQSISEAHQIICPRCHGQGTIRNIASQASALIHLIQESVTKEKSNQIHVQVPVNIATYLLNEKREAIQNIEKLHSINVVIIPNPYIEIPQYKIERFQKQQDIKNPLSYDLLTMPTLTYKPEPIKPTVPKKEPVVKEMLHAIPAPIRKLKKPTFGKLFKNIWEFLIASDQPKEKETKFRDRKPYPHKGKKPFYKNRRTNGQDRSQYKSQKYFGKKPEDFAKRESTKVMPTAKKPEQEIPRKAIQVESKVESKPENIIKPQEKTHKESDKLIMVETKKDK